MKTQRNTNRLKIYQYKDGAIATFNTYIVSENTDNGRRVKHIVYKDKELNAYWHQITFLSSGPIEPIKSIEEFVSERVFWGKVRLVEKRVCMLPETWMKIAHAVEILMELGL